VKCPSCSDKTRVITQQVGMRRMRRERECRSCGFSFMTLEIAVVDTPAAQDMIDWIGENMSSMAGFDVPDEKEQNNANT